MPWGPPVLAHVDGLGRLFCVQCRPELGDAVKDASGYPAPVHGDQWFSPEDKCEQCSKQLEHVPTSQYVKV